MRWSELENRDLAILGFGREGRAVLRALQRRFPGHPVTVYDEAAIPDVEADAVTIRVGPFDAAQLAGHQVAIRSPGISPYREALSGARARGLQFTTGSSIWFAEHPRARTVCITGTKGKSTSSALVAHLLGKAGLEVELAGNIGVPLLEHHAASPDWWVVELSSYQLADLQAFPEFAAILNLSDEHLDWHQGAANYRRDKLRLAGMVPAGNLVLNHRDPLLRAEGNASTRWFGRQDGWHAEAGSLWHGEDRVLDAADFPLRGQHNLENLAAVMTLVEACGAPLPDLGEALQDFKGLPHRLQALGTKGGCNWINDSLSTTPVATLAALNAVDAATTVLLVGGMDRGLGWDAAAAAMLQRPPRAVICMPDNGPRIAAALRAQGAAQRTQLALVASLGEAVGKARELAHDNDTILLSPGAPSFPHFRDYAERGLRFAHLAGFDV